MCNPTRQARQLRREANQIARRLAPRFVRPAADRMELGAQLDRPRPQAAIPGRGDVSPPPLVANGGEQIEQAALRASKVTELIEEENVHRRPALQRRAPRSKAAARASK